MITTWKPLIAEPIITSTTEPGILFRTNQKKIAFIQWRADGKIAHINRIAGYGKKNLGFDYDPMGNRIAKHQYNDAGVWEKSTYYTRDASGNVMAGDAYSLIERDIYGSSRLGMDITPIDMIATDGNPLSLQVKHILGLKQYEMSNHLGNVQAVVSDYKIPVDDGSNGGVANDGIGDYQIANILSAQDYYPFGMIMPGRNVSSSDGYRFGFNGQERDDEIKGLANSLNFGARIYDPRVARFFSVDALSYKVPGWTPYRHAAFHQTRLHQLIHQRLPHILNIHLVPPAEPFQLLPELRRTLRVHAPDVRRVLLLLHLRPARGAHHRPLHALRTLSPHLHHHTTHIRNHFPRLFHHNRIAVVDVQPSYLIDVVQRRVRHRRPRQKHRLQPTHRCQRATLAHLPVHPVQHRLHLLGLILVRNHPPRGLVRRSQPFSLRE